MAALVSSQQALECLHIPGTEAREPVIYGKACENAGSLGRASQGRNACAGLPVMFPFPGDA